MGKKEEIKEKVQEIQLVIFRLRDEEFGARINAVLEISRVLPITHIPEAPGFIEGVVNLRGQVIAVVDLARQFGLARQAELPKTARIVVVEIAGETIGLIVDAVPEVIRIPEDAIEPTPELIQTKIQKDYIQGVAKLDTRLIIVLNLDQVLSARDVQSLGKMAEGA